MEKIIIIIILFCTIYISNADVIISIDDPIGDDYGKGSIIYPEHEMFDPGIFDITGFTISQKNEDYVFMINLNGKVNSVKHDEFEYSYNLAEDFILPLVHIYIDKDHVEGSGFTKMINGTNANISQENAWEQVLVIASMAERYRGELERSQPEIAHNAIIPESIDISRDKKSIEVTIPKKILGELDKKWGFTILMMCQEFSQTIEKSVYIKDVKSTASQYNFGGGEGNILKNYDSNIIDMIVPLGTRQEEILSSFNADKKKYVELSAIYPVLTELKRNLNIGKVKQVSEEKVVVNLGSDNGIEKGSELIIENKYIIIVSDVFPGLSMATYLNPDDWEKVTINMNVSKKK